MVHYVFASKNVNFLNLFIYFPQYSKILLCTYATGRRCGQYLNTQLESGKRANQKKFCKKKPTKSQIGN